MIRFLDYLTDVEITQLQILNRNFYRRIIQNYALYLRKPLIHSEKMKKLDGFYHFNFGKIYQLKYYMLKEGTIPKWNQLDPGNLK